MTNTSVRILAACAAAAGLALGLATSALAQASPETPPAAEQAPAEPTTAAPAEATATPPETAPPAAATPAAPPAEVARGVSAPPPGKGQIIFFRQSRFAGGGVSFSIREGDAGVARLGNGQYFVHITDPGIHEYNTESEATDTLRREIEEGETYFVQQSLNMGIMLYRPALTPSDRAKFEEKPLRLTTRPGVDRRRDSD
jgi:hypothetical protein